MQLPSKNQRKLALTQVIEMANIGCLKVAAESLLGKILLRPADRGRGNVHAAYLIALSGKPQ